MKASESLPSKNLWRGRIVPLCLASVVSVSSAADFEWTMSGNLGPALGNGVMTYVDAATVGLTSFGTTDGVTVPHINNQPATFLSVPAFSDPANGYHLTFVDVSPNGGGSYLNQYTFIADILSPGDLNWTPLFNTEPSNANDADFYISPEGAIGIGDLGYSSSGLIAADAWYRIAFTADLAAGEVTYYINGTAVHQRTGGALTDGRFSLYTHQDAGPDLLLFNEGDSSGQYTHSLLVNSIYFTDRTLSAAQIAALGGASALGIQVPEPGSLALLGLAGLTLLARRRARRH